MTVGSHDPFASSPSVPSFGLSSPELGPDGALATAHYSARQGVPGGEDASPALRWESVPEGTLSFLVACFDADAALMSGFWHWFVADVPGNAGGLEARAGTPGGHLLPPGSRHIPNDARVSSYVGAAPPPGDGPHRYYFIVWALDVEALALPDEVTPALVSAIARTHVIGRAALIGIADVAADGSVAAGLTRPDDRSKIGRVR